MTIVSVLQSVGEKLIQNSLKWGEGNEKWRKGNEENQK